MNLVMAHGIFQFSQVGPVVYYNGVGEHLMAKFPDLRLIAPEVAWDGTIEQRGDDLGRHIAEALQPGGVFDAGEPVHIIAHSMGGLDARYLLSPANPNNMADRVVSLTTIAAPHKGSPIADVLIEIEQALDSNVELRLLDHALHKALNHANIATGGLQDITTEGAKRFNDAHPDNPSTKKFSVAGVGRGAEVLGISLDTCLALRLPHRIIEQRTGEANDGCVSLSSATWGDGPELWPADHADEIGHNLDQGLTGRPHHFDYLSKYEALVDRLRQL